MDSGIFKQLGKEARVPKLAQSIQILAFSFNLGIASPGWDLYDLRFPESSLGYAVGNSGAILKTTDQGTTWNQIPGPTLQSIQGVHFFSANYGFVAGGGGVFKTMNGGTTWTKVIGGNVFENLSAPDEDTLYAMRSSAIFKSVDGGDSWTEQLSLGSGRFTSSHFLSPQTGFVVGFNGLVRKTEDGGINWTTLSIGINKIINKLFFHNADNGFVVGEVFMRTRNGGVTWEPCIQGTTPYLQSIHFPDALHGFALGIYGEIFKTSDGGNTWTKSSLNIFPGMTLNIRFLNSEKGFILGAGTFSESYIYSTTDGGDTWTRLAHSMKFMSVSIRNDFRGDKTHRGFLYPANVYDFQTKKYLLNGRRNVVLPSSVAERNR